MAVLVKRSLKSHEEIIESGIRSFLDVGRSLLAIRDERLYKDDYDSFEAYCQGRWKFTRQRAHMYIESTVAVDDLSTIVDKKIEESSGNSESRKLKNQIPIPVQIPPPINESQARAIAEAAPDANTRRHIWQAVAINAPKDKAGNPKITASLVKKVAAKITGKSNGKPEPAETATEPLPIPPREPGEDATEPQHVLPTDKSGNAIPDRPALVKAFRSRDLFVSCEKAREVIHNNCYEIAKLIPEGMKFRDAVDKLMKALFATLRQHEPAYVCKGCAGGGCQRCRKRGYTTVK